MFADKTMEASTITGTGSYQLGTPVGAFQSWRTTFATASIVFYYAENGDGSSWEYGYGTFTTGSPDTISRTVLGSSTGSAISWVVGDAPIYVYSVPIGVMLKHLALGGRATARPAWAQRGLRWLDESDANAWTTTRAIDKIYDGAADHELGRYEATPGIYVASPRRPTLVVGGAGLTLTANHVGWRLTFDTSAASRALTLPAIASVDKGYMVSGLGLSAANGVVITPNGSEVVDFGAGGATLTIPGKVPFDLWSDGTQWRTNYSPSAPYSGIRQTIAAGPVDTAGLPTFLPSSSVSLNLTTQNLSSSAPLVAAAANGWSAATGAPVDSVAISIANFTWSSLTASRAAATPNFLYGTIAAGVLTPLSTILAPIYQSGGTPSTTNGQITFNISEMKAYLGNGSTAPQTNLVLFGEAATDGSTVIGTVAYAYNGKFESAFTATLPSAATFTSANHNIGVPPRVARFIIENTTLDNGWPVGSQVTDGLSGTNGAGTESPIAIATDSKTIGVQMPGSGLGLVARTGGNYFAPTAASWKYKFVARRGWE